MVTRRQLTHAPPRVPGWAERTCRWSAWTPPRSARTTAPQGSASASTSCRPWKKPRMSRKQPGKKGRHGGTERTGRAPADPAPTQAPPEGSPARPVPGRPHQQDSPCRGPQMPSPRVRPDRRTGRGQPSVHPRAREGAGPSAARPSPHQARRSRRRQGLLIPRRPLLPAQTQHQSDSPGEARPGRQPEEEGLTRWPARRPRRRPPQGTEHRRTPDQQAEGLARHRHPLRRLARLRTQGRYPASAACCRRLGDGRARM